MQAQNLHRSRYVRVYTCYMQRQRPRHVLNCGSLTLCRDRDMSQEGNAEVGGSIFNLVKNIVGSGILALPGGVAVFSHAKVSRFCNCVHIRDSVQLSQVCSQSSLQSTCSRHALPCVTMHAYLPHTGCACASQCTHRCHGAAQWLLLQVSQAHTYMHTYIHG